jgi:transposase
MAARLSRKRLPRYSLEFKRGAVRLTQMPGMEVQVVAKALDIHPVMLSRWRQEAREGRLKGSSPRTKVVKVRTVVKVKVPATREVKRLQELETAHRLLQEEHDLLKKAIRFCSARSQGSSPSSKRSAKRSR